MDIRKEKLVCELPDGLRELCADISREVIRYQPKDIYEFVADYLDSLAITHENAKVAATVVKNVILDSQRIVTILSGTGLNLQEIVSAIPRLKVAFRAYLNAIGSKLECGCNASTADLDDGSEISLCRILCETGASYDQAQRAAIKIQALFRGHYERMSLGEKRGQVQWQRAAMNTMEILRNAGITITEAVNAATTIQSVYRGYYTRKNLKHRTAEASETVGANASLETIYQNFQTTGLTLEQASQAAITEQRYEGRKYSSVEGLTSSSELSNPSESSDIGQPKDELKDLQPIDGDPDVAIIEPKAEPVVDISDDAESAGPDRQDEESIEKSSDDRMAEDEENEIDHDETNEGEEKLRDKDDTNDVMPEAEDHDEKSSDHVH